MPAIVRLIFLVVLADTVLADTVLADTVLADTVQADTAARAAEPQSATVYQDEIRPSLVRWCGDCHDPDDTHDPVGFLKAETADQIAEMRDVWSSVAQQITNRTMPPADADQPTEAERLRLAKWIDQHLESTACTGEAFAGRPGPRRLNRDQYTHAIKDLTGLDFDFVHKFPADGGGGEGFDNNGETLFLPPILMERYLEAAIEITDRFVVTPPLVQRLSSQPNSPVRTTDDQSTDLQTNGDRTLVADRITVPFRDWFGIAIWFPGTIAREQTVRVTVDGIESDELVIRPDQPYHLWFTTVELDRGQHAIQVIAPEPDGGRRDGDLNSLGSVTVLQLPEALQVAGKYKGEENEKRRKAMADACREFVKRHSDLKPTAFREAYDDRFTELSGTPLAQRRQATSKLLHRSEPGVPLSRLKVSRGEAIDAIDRWGRLAWRRPIDETESKRLASLLDRGLKRGETMRQAMKLPLQSILVSPNFLFATESQTDDEATPGQPVRITDLELATRLARFLWHSIPDEQLLNVAMAGQLHHPEVLDKQIDRMIADDRSRRFAEAFASQWLGTVAVGRTVIPDTNFFRPEYSDDLVQDLRRQVTETMHWMMLADRPITDWIDGQHVVVNHRLAKHYALDAITQELKKGDPAFRSFPVSDDPKLSVRGGAMGLGAVHMLTSYSRRTSPVLRGTWVLEAMFGTRVPAPPPDVPTLPGGEKESKDQTVRERLAEHRENPNCAACHDLIDPLGFALENFDVLGRWRDVETKKQPIDASGKMPSGETFDGVLELRRVLVDRRDDFRREHVRRMLGFALGRSLSQQDACAISSIASQLESQEDRLVALVKAIVQSLPFTHVDPEVTP